MPQPFVSQATRVEREQFAEAESQLIYDEMLRLGRVIEVTANGVRVFDLAGVFIRDEVLKAKVVFPRIDVTPRLERKLSRLMEGDELAAERVRAELFQAVYRPVKSGLDNVLQNWATFFSDPASFQNVCSDLNGVVGRMDVLTLGMLNEILEKGDLKFRRHIETGVYSGLVGSAIFGEFKRKLSDRKVVEDLILLGLLHDLDSRLEKSKNFQELRRTTKASYDAEKVLDEVRTNPDRPTSIVSEVISTALAYVEALDQIPEREPFAAFVALQSRADEPHAVAIGALAKKFGLPEYLISYLRRCGEFRRELRSSEERLAEALAARLAKEPAPPVRKLAEALLRELRLRWTLQSGIETLQRLDEFVGALLPLHEAAKEFLDRIASIERSDYERLHRLIAKVAETVEGCIACRERYSVPTNWPDLEDVFGACYLLVYRDREVIEACIQRALKVIGRFSEQAAQFDSLDKEVVFRRALDDLERHAAALTPFGAPTAP